MTDALKYMKENCYRKRFTVPGETDVSVGLKEIILLYKWSVDSSNCHFLMGC